MLTGLKTLAKVSQTPGKTQLINHFLINESWYLVDLPGYGYAKVSKTSRQVFSEMITQYIKNRENLFCLFVLIDSRHEPLKNDIAFINWLGENQIPFALIFTKTDKINATTLEKNIEQLKQEMLKSWEELPRIFSSSAVTQSGREQIISYIEEVCN
jgi:GTP-binding protein